MNEMCFDDEALGIIHSSFLPTYNTHVLLHNRFCNCMLLILYRVGYSKVCYTVAIYCYTKVGVQWASHAKRWPPGHGMTNIPSGLFPFQCNGPIIYGLLFAWVFFAAVCPILISLYFYFTVTLYFGNQVKREKRPPSKKRSQN